MLYYIACGALVILSMTFTALLAYAMYDEHKSEKGEDNEYIR